jgi:predicted nucleic acid-binding protein
MSVNIFIDTNIFVYAKLIHAKEPEKHEKAVYFLKNQLKNIIISTQVLNEFAQVLLKHHIDDHTILAAVQQISEETTVLPITLATVNKAWQIKIQYHFSYWDSLIIAVALLEKCEVLFTEDLQHNQLIEKQLIIKNPFLL